MPVALTDDEVTRLFPVLAKRARASEDTSGAFRPPRVGIVEEVAGDWHHFVVGRRGVGKSMLLLNVHQHVLGAGKPSVYIDLETLRDNPYPDVLIRLLIGLATELDRHLDRSGHRQPGRRRARRELSKLKNRLEALLADPLESRYQVSRSSSRSRRTRLRSRLGAAIIGHGAAGAAVVRDERFSENQSHTASQAEFVHTKLEGLQREAAEFRSALELAVRATGRRGAVVVLDDFYFIRKENQPDVLSYLQQVVKNLGIWLKVGAVEHRLNEFEDGDPPRGMQRNQDAASVAMDVTLATFDHTRKFLESILKDICVECAVDMDSLLTNTPRTRLVLASGGVPRDYVNLVTASLDKATRRPGSAARPKNRITAEDVNLAAPQFLKQKEDDLRVDAIREDIDRLRSQLYDVINFCLVRHKTNVFTVEGRVLHQEQWGRDISALADLRFFHRIGQLTIKSSAAEFVGHRYEGFALDLSAYAATRVRATKEIEFWTSKGFQDVRALSHVYTPGAGSESPPTAERGTFADGAAEPVVEMSDTQISIYDALADLETDATDEAED